ncbi:MAG: hypothetical protein ACKO6N_04480 [Myxococcota bacterium]
MFSARHWFGSTGLLLLLTGLLACAPGVRTWVAKTPQPLKVEDVAVYPFTVQFYGNASLSYERTVDLVSSVLEPGRFRVYSFGDFQVFTQENVGLYEGRSLLQVIKAENIALEGLALLKGGATLVPESFDRAPKREDGTRTVTGPITVDLYIELYHYQQQLRLARAEQRLVLDPLKATPNDPFPELTVAVRALADKTLSLASKNIQPGRILPTYPLVTYADHSLLFKIATDDKPSLGRFMLSQDEVDAEISVLKGYQYFYPEITLLEAQRLNATPGVMIKQLPEGWMQGQGLEVGDIIQKIQGMLVSAEHQLRRWAALQKPGERFTFTITRQGKVIELPIQKP